MTQRCRRSRSWDGRTGKTFLALAAALEQVVGWVAIERSLSIDPGACGTKEVAISQAISREAGSMDASVHDICTRCSPTPVPREHVPPSRAIGPRRVGVAAYLSAGRSITGEIVIIDEAQNPSYDAQGDPDQMSRDSKLSFCGDLTRSTSYISPFVGAAALIEKFKGSPSSPFPLERSVRSPSPNGRHRL